MTCETSAQWPPTSEMRAGPRETRPKLINIRQTQHREQASKRKREETDQQTSFWSPNEDGGNNREQTLALRKLKVMVSIREREGGIKGSEGFYCRPMLIVALAGAQLMVVADARVRFPRCARSGTTTLLYSIPLTRRTINKMEIREVTKLRKTPPFLLSQHALGPSRGLAV